MTYAYNTFDAWLRGHSPGANLEDTGELWDRTSQCFFASQYSIGAFVVASIWLLFYVIAAIDALASGN